MKKLPIWGAFLACDAAKVRAKKKRNPRAASAAPPPPTGGFFLFRKNSHKSKQKRTKQNRRPQTLRAALNSSAFPLDFTVGTFLINYLYFKFTVSLDLTVGTFRTNLFIYIKFSVLVRLSSTEISCYL